MFDSQENFHLNGGSMISQRGGGGFGVHVPNTKQGEPTCYFRRSSLKLDEIEKYDVVTLPHVLARKIMTS